MVTRLMSRLYRCFVYVMQNRAICALPFDWDRTFLCGACDSFQWRIQGEGIGGQFPPPPRAAR